MQTEAILIALTGLISLVVTSPLAAKHAPSMLQPSAVAAESGSLNMSQTVQETRIQRLQGYCSVSVGDDGCVAYKEMIGIAEKFKLTEVKDMIDKELSHNLSEAEDDSFCGDLSKTLKRLPLRLSSRALEPFKRTPTCVGSCYVKDTGLKDVCRALFVGYRAILQPVDKQEIAHHGTDVPVSKDKPESIANQSGFVKVVPAVADVRKSAVDEIKIKTPLPTGNGTEKMNKKDDTDINAKSAPLLIPPSGDIGQANKPKEEVKLPAGEPDAGPKVFEKASKEQSMPMPIPEQVPQEAAVPKKSEDNVDQQQGEIDDAGGDMAPFDDEPKQASNQDAKGATQPGDDISDESDGNGSQEDVNDNGDDVENVFPHIEKQPAEAPEKVKQDEFSESSKASDIVPGIDPFYEQKDSNFFSYFLFAMFSCAMLYVAYHNKSKLLALVVEGRRTNSGRGGFSKGRKHTAAYRKLDSNLEEAITSGSGSGGHSSSQIIY